MKKLSFFHTPFFNLGLDFTICFVVKYEMVIFGEVCPKIPEYIGRAK